MNILITNDDGIFADGIGILAKVLSEKHKVIVVAPDSECSGTSHSLTIFKKLSYEVYDCFEGIEAYAVKGTPSDCVKFAVKVLLDKEPDLVISGINNFPNLGTDVIYSGTVNAALEGAICGIRSIAVSAMFEDDGDYEYVSHFLSENIEKIHSILPKDTIFNINFPSCKAERLKGVRFTRLGVQLYSDAYVPHEGTERQYYLTGDIIKAECNDADCDVELHDAMYITFVPMHIQMTDFSALARLKKLKHGLEI